VYKPTFTVLKKLTTVLAGSTNVTGFTAWDFSCPFRSVHQFQLSTLTWTLIIPYAADACNIIHHRWIFGMTFYLHRRGVWTHQAAKIILRFPHRNEKCYKRISAHFRFTRKGYILSEIPCFGLGHFIPHRLTLAAEWVPFFLEDCLVNSSWVLVALVGIEKFWTSSSNFALFFPRYNHPWNENFTYKT
jgi:hypothetical protein